MAQPKTLTEMAVDVLTTADGREKTAKSRSYAKAWRLAREKDEQAQAGTGSSASDGGEADHSRIEIGTQCPPDRPARPDVPALLEPRDVPKRKPGTKQGRTAILHAVAHIELNAVDLHWDIIARFSHIPMPWGFYDDWVRAADEESKHFNLMCDCLEAMGSFYGALPAHAGMWRAATDTADDLLGRLAIVPMVLEARGLDVTPGMIAIFQKAADDQVVKALQVIYAEEVSHVAYGSKWFNFCCGRENSDPKIVFHQLVRKYFKGGLKPPFNEEKRAEAGLPPDFYWPLADGG